MSISIPYMQIRGGSSKGVYFKAEDLPADETERQQAVLGAMEGVGFGDPRQIDGLGGADSLTSKVAIVSLSEDPKADIDFLFYQVVVGEGKISTVQNCGNILAGVLPFAIESGMIKADEGKTTRNVLMKNSGSYCEITVYTPNGTVNYNGDTSIDGVLGSSAPVICTYLDIAGSSTGAMFPTGNVVDNIEDIEVTCVDNGMPVVMLRAKDFGISGYESPAELEANEALYNRIEKVRLKAGKLMNLGDVSEKTIPKMCLTSASRNDGLIETRMFIPKKVHKAIGVLAAVSAATAAICPGSVIEDIAQIHSDLSQPMIVEHPSGKFEVALEVEIVNRQPEVRKSGVVRTARLISKGEVYIP